MSDPTQSTDQPTESEWMIRQTWLVAFDEPAAFSRFEEAGAGIVHHAREAGLWGLDVPRSLDGIGADLDSLASCLEEVAEMPADSSVTRDELAPCDSVVVAPARVSSRAQSKEHLAHGRARQGEEVGGESDPTDTRRTVSASGKTPPGRWAWSWRRCLRHALAR